MKHHVGLTIDAKLLRQIETIRGREKRSTFIEHLIILGLKTYMTEQNHADGIQSHTPLTATLRAR